MNMFIEEKELDEVKEALARWAKEFPEDYDPERINTVSFTEKEFFTVVKRVLNLERQNKECANLRLSDFTIPSIVMYLIESKAVKEVLWVDSSHEYEIKTNFSHVHGSNGDRVIIVY